MAKTIFFHRAVRVLFVSSFAAVFLVAHAFCATSDLYKIKASTKLSDGTAMVYRLYVPPSYDPSKKYPLVLLLHGGGEIGSDGNNQLNNGPIGLPWIADSVQKKWAPFALAPQCPTNHSFSTNGKADMAGEGAIKLIDSLKKVYSLDTTRFYVGGHSFGGVGTLGIMGSYPDKFAAAVPCASNPGGPNSTMTTMDAAIVSKTPLWAFHGDADQTVNIGPIRNIVTAVENSGNKVVRFYSSALMKSPTGISIDSLSRAIKGGAKYLFSEVKGGDHGAGCEEGWRNPLLVGWLFTKAKVNGQTVKWPLETSTVKNTTASAKPGSYDAWVYSLNGKKICRAQEFAQNRHARCGVYLVVNKAGTRPIALFHRE